MIMKPVRLDDTDRRILRALQADGGLSHAALAERVGASTASCWRRIKALEDAEVLTGVVRLVDAASVGRGVNVMCQVRMRSHAPDDRRAFEDYLLTRADVMEAHSMSGDWDYLLRVVATDVAGYERFLMGDLLNHPNVDTASSHFALSQVKYTTAIPI
ncbi:MAG: Lrp/AsnC family transcriptional regulator [Brevundimonas aurantiaca]|jgi:DNA-binding Lrp family transcriptional regulator|uniref:Lrp/AsnC family transcriptional regulator n=1 Tax=Brevundimonas TaxID=41275 RepID=UPI00289E5BED|nr:Lrp/AsnC family transcriptional regulator [Brevundimonas sp.]